MFTFISFVVKIVFASILGGAINYVPGKTVKDEIIVRSTLICLLSTSIISITKQLSPGSDYSLVGFGIVSSLFVVLIVSGKLNFIDRVILIFICVLGIVIGVGYFFQAIMLALLIYYIIHNAKDVLDFVYTKGDVLDSSFNMKEEVENE